METKCVCPHCGRGLSRPDNLSRHIFNVHPGEWLKTRTSPALAKYERDKSILNDRIAGMTVSSLAVKYGVCIRTVRYVLAAGPSAMDNELMRLKRNIDILHDHLDLHLKQREIAARHGVSRMSVWRILTL